MSKAVFSFDLETIGDDTILVIVDRYDENNPSVTVTNNIDSVLSDIFSELPKIPSKIIYRDSEGVWDQIMVDLMGNFLTFAPIEVGLHERIKDRSIALEYISQMVA
jgi:hypothetical protein